MIVEFDSLRFLAAVQGLSQLSGYSFEEVLAHQVAAVLRNAIQGTPSAKSEHIVKRMSGSFVRFADGTQISRWNKANGAEMFLDDSTWPPNRLEGRPKKIIGGKTWHQMDAGNFPPRRWSDARWSKYQSALARAEQQRQANIAAAKKARGVTAQVWLQIARDLNLENNPRLGGVPARIRTAKRTSGKNYKNGLGRKIIEQAALYFELVNSDPIIRQNRVGGARILQIAIEKRARAFEFEMRNGVFSDLTTRAKRYPGLFIAP